MNESEQQEQREKPLFNPAEHLIQLKSREGAKDYLPVMWRLVWFRLVFPAGTIETEEMCVDLDRETSEDAYVWNNEKRRSEKVVKTAKGYARYKAVITTPIGGRGTGHKAETAAGFADYAEKAETGAKGRALADLGFGTQFAPELDEGHRIVDAPIDPTQPAFPNPSATQQELAELKKYCDEMNIEMPRKEYTSLEIKAIIEILKEQQKRIKAAVAKPSAPKQEHAVAKPQPATPEQEASIVKLCEHLGRAIPDGERTFDEAKKLIQELTATVREAKKPPVQQQQPQQQQESKAPTATIQVRKPQALPDGPQAVIQEPKKSQVEHAEDEQQRKIIKVCSTFMTPEQMDGIAGKIGINQKDTRKWNDVDRKVFVAQLAKEPSVGRLQEEATTILAYGLTSHEINRLKERYHIQKDDRSLKNTAILLPDMQEAMPWIDLAKIFDPGLQHLRTLNVSSFLDFFGPAKNEDAIEGYKAFIHTQFHNEQLYQRLYTAEYEKIRKRNETRIKKIVQDEQIPALAPITAIA